MYLSLNYFILYALHSNKNYKKYKRNKNYSQEINPSIEPVSEMTRMLELSHWDCKITDECVKS